MSIFEKAIHDATATIESLRPLQSVHEQAAEVVGRCLLSGHKLLVCGNGGSAADAADFATEFACRFVSDRRPYPALNLAACGSLLTAIGNDYGYDEVFARQVRAFGQRDDVFVAISTSGNSKSIISAIAAANIAGLHTIALLGRDGGRARGLAQMELIVPTDITARIQEAHKFLLHTLCEIVEARFILPKQEAR
ncbi:phosphoheptose isomerase [Chthoniobacter flavus Ellin428]|uniref:Phosphoheptose isomerase n=1 Tax=Chthoniobacter flavus Ellin428 TaxID=497964 RepID=B4CZP7_9BACT|nr:SIS domain-containing protein [Chthoniobacter flavus]EDY20211.1 phosphoheptose isomerase [Chthoniobacter flavus Ellin428]TCO94108.1 phosphoheptose isomerase [Chthoniobacter flavus]